MANSKVTCKVTFFVCFIPDPISAAVPAYSQPTCSQTTCGTSTLNEVVYISQLAFLDPLRPPSPAATIYAGSLFLLHTFCSASYCRDRIRTQLICYVSPQGASNTKSIKRGSTSAPICRPPSPKKSFYARLRSCLRIAHCASHLFSHISMRLILHLSLNNTTTTEKTKNVSPCAHLDPAPAYRTLRNTHSP